MIIFHKGEVVLVQIDFTDGSGSKWRPVVIVSSDEYNNNSPDVIIASITGNLKAIPHPGDHIIVEWEKAGLKLPSIAQVKVATVEKSMIGRKLGIMFENDIHSMNKGLKRALGL